MQNGAARAPGGSGRAGGTPLSRWWILAFTVPCLVTVAVSGVVVLQNLAGAMGNCFDTCEAPSYLRHLQAVSTVEFLVGLAAAVTALTGLARPSWRRALAGVSGVLCLLALLGLHAR
jgi:hypothetical protein